MNTHHPIPRVDRDWLSSILKVPDSVSVNLALENILRKIDTPLNTHVVTQNQKLEGGANGLLSLEQHRWDNLRAVRGGEIIIFRLNCIALGLELPRYQLA